MDKTTTPTEGPAPDQAHVSYEGKTYRRTMDPDVFEAQYEHELDKREEAKKRRIEAQNGKKPQ